MMRLPNQAVAVRVLVVVTVVAVVAAVVGILSIANGTAYRRDGMTTAVCTARAKNPNEGRLAAGRTIGLWTCQDSFRVAAGDVYTFVPWFKAGSTLKSMVGWRYQVLPSEGSCRVTAYIHGAAIADTMPIVCGPDSAVAAISDGTLIDSLTIRGIVLCKGRVRAQ